MAGQEENGEQVASAPPFRARLKMYVLLIAYIFSIKVRCVFAPPHPSHWRILASLLSTAHIAG